MMENKNVRCKKCLLADIDAGEELEKIKHLISIMPAKEKASEAEYKARLEACKECEKLIEATCILCGCYVELRAAKKKNSCPAKKW